MTARPRYTKDKYIRLIHVAMHKLNMDDDTYRAMLHRVTGKDSCKAMKVSELDKVLAEMEDKGFKNTARQFGKTDRTYSAQPGTSKPRSRIAYKIRAIWADMAKNGMVRDGSQQALNAWVRSVANPIYAKWGKNMQVLNVGALDDRMAVIVLERLKKWQARGAK